MHTTRGITGKRKRSPRRNDGSQESQTVDRKQKCWFHDRHKWAFKPGRPLPQKLEVNFVMVRYRINQIHSLETVNVCIKSKSAYWMVARIFQRCHLSHTVFMLSNSSLNSYFLFHFFAASHFNSSVTLWADLNSKQYTGHICV